MLANGHRRRIREVTSGCSIYLIKLSGYTTKMNIKYNNSISAWYIIYFRKTKQKITSKTLCQIIVFFFGYAKLNYVKSTGVVRLNISSCARFSRGPLQSHEIFYVSLIIFGRQTIAIKMTWNEHIALIFVSFPSNSTLLYNSFSNIVESIYLLRLSFKISLKCFASTVLVSAAPRKKLCRRHSSHLNLSPQIFHSCKKRLKLFSTTALSAGISTVLGSSVAERRPVWFLIWKHAPDKYLSNFTFLVQNYGSLFLELVTKFTKIFYFIYYMGSLEPLVVSFSRNTLSILSSLNFKLSDVLST